MKIIVTSQVYDALRKAGLLIETPASEKTPWTTWGSEREDELIDCELIDGEEIRLP